jgi:hemoglobin-like flavoprotein
MTPAQKVLVQESFARVAPIADTAGALFYERLFALDPTLRELFRSDMREQRRKLMQMLAVAVHNLDNVENILPALHALGRRHAVYGVTGQHFTVVGEALMWTLERGLGEAFTAEVRDAWCAVYQALVEIMLDGMQSSERVAA